MRGAWPYLASAAMIAAVSWPLTWTPGTDGFPLSRFPMFVMPRPSTQVFLYVVAVEPGGTAHKIDSRAWTPGGPNLGGAVLRATQARSPADMDALCARIARNAGDRDPAWPAGTTVEIRSGIFSHKRFARTGSATPGGFRALATCAVTSG